MTTINVNDKELTRKLGILAAGMSDLTPLAKAIEGSFLAVVEDNFRAGGRPRWAGLSPSGERSFLLGKGRLQGGIVSSSTVNEVSIGINLKYARIHQLGGFAGRGGKAKIPARPYLPMDKNGSLQLAAVDAIHDDVDFYLDKLARK